MEICHRNGIRCRVVASEVSEQEAHGVAQLAVGVCELFEDAIPEARVFGVLDRPNPEAKDIRAVAVNCPEWINRIALGLGHFVAKLIHGKAICNHGAVRRHSTHRGCNHQG